MRAVVTGASGFLGRHLLKEIHARGDFAEVLALSRGAVSLPGARTFSHQCDVTERGWVRYLVEKFRPDVVFHLAANPNTRLGAEDPEGELLWHTNVDGTKNVLDACPKGCYFVLASSATVYGDAADCRHSVEEDAPKPTSLYGASKAAAEALVHACGALGKVRPLVLRFIALVGPGATHGLLPDLVRKLRSDAPELELLGACPGSCKPFMHVREAARRTAEMARLGATGVFNVGPDDNLTVRDVAELVMTRLGRRKPLRWLGASANWAGDNRAVLIDPFRARGLFAPAPLCGPSTLAVASAAEEIDKEMSA